MGVLNEIVFHAVFSAVGALILALPGALVLCWAVRLTAGFRPRYLRTWLATWLGYLASIAASTAAMLGAYLIGHGIGATRAGVDGLLAWLLLPVLGVGFVLQAIIINAMLKPQADGRMGLGPALLANLVHVAAIGAFMLALFLWDFMARG
ncbi:MAG: hypothetical protein JJT95_15640 [Pararhodobacter sp.]|nr:hypothetical protein [Pararhodobacter sp.]